jgi:hypothetical protein
MEATMISINFTRTARALRYRKGLAGVRALVVRISS